MGCLSDLLFICSPRPCLQAANRDVPVRREKGPGRFAPVVFACSGLHYHEVLGCVLCPPGVPTLAHHSLLHAPRAVQLPLTGTFAWVAPEILMVGAAAFLPAGGQLREVPAEWEAP